MTRASTSSTAQPAPDLTGVSGLPPALCGARPPGPDRSVFLALPRTRAPGGLGPRRRSPSPPHPDLERKTDPMSNVEPAASLPKRPAPVRHPRFRVMSPCKEANPPGAQQVVAELLVAPLTNSIPAQSL